MGRRRAAPRETEQDEAVAPRVEQEEFQPLLSLTDFTKTVKNYPDTTGAVLYFYRLKPKINRKLVGIKFKYIERMTPPFPEDFIRYLRSTHGGGEYEIHMTDAKKVPAPVCRAQIIVPLEDCDPIIQNPAELVRGEAYTEQLIARWRAEGKVIVKEDGTLAVGQGPERVARRFHRGCGWGGSCFNNPAARGGHATRPGDAWPYGVSPSGHTGLDAFEPSRQRTYHAAGPSQAPRMRIAPRPPCRAFPAHGAAPAGLTARACS
ncbi:hypothetical protein J4558_27475 [Leptolyngbya sp. 15MV]|nr:hypothetical protein J4558_27475 [Leptolyngbya sp. 15MV]